jgi:small subunit ribosomal protein S1
VVQVGDELEVMVLDVDEERRRISLGIKQVTSNPWETFAAIHKKGDKVKGQIKSITDFGIFIGLPGGIDGLVHLSDLDWNDDGANAVRRYSKGMEVDAVVLAIDAARERISLGVKQIEQDPLGSSWRPRRRAPSSLASFAKWTPRAQRSRFPMASKVMSAPATSPRSASKTQPST